MSDTYSAEDFKDDQAILELTNNGIAQVLNVSLKTIESVRNGRWEIHGAVEKTMAILVYLKGRHPDIYNEVIDL